MEYYEMLARAPEHARSMDKVYSKYWVCIMQTHLRQSTLRTGVVTGLREDAVKLEVFRDPGFDYVSSEWTGFLELNVGVCALLLYQH